MLLPCYVLLRTTPCLRLLPIAICYLSRILFPADRGFVVVMHGITGCLATHVCQMSVGRNSQYRRSPDKLLDDAAHIDEGVLQTECLMGVSSILGRICANFSLTSHNSGALSRL